jgi:hypothetical protein
MILRRVVNSAPVGGILHPRNAWGLGWPSRGLRVARWSRACLEPSELARNSFRRFLPGRFPWRSPRVSSARVRSTRYTSRPWCCKCWTREMTAFAGFRSVHFVRAWGWQAWVSAFCPTVPRRLFPGMGARPVRWGRALVLHGLRRACGACGAPATHARVVTGRGLSGVR